MIRFILSAVVSLWTVMNVSAQTIKLEGVKSLLAKEDKFDKLRLYLSLGKPNTLKIYTSPKNKILSYEQNPLQAKAINNLNYNQIEQCWEVLKPKTSCGYIIKEEGQLNHYIYLLDYEDYAFEPKNLKVEEVPDDPCRRILLSWEGAVNPMLYYGSTAAAKKLERSVELNYKSLHYSDKDEQFIAQEVKEELEVEGESHELTASLSDTPYVFAGDKWQKAFKLKLPKLSSEPYPSKRLEVHSLISLFDEEGKEIIQDDWQLLSAPVRVEMTVVSNNEAKQRFRWLLRKKDKDTKDEEIILDYNGRETEYNLTQAGYYKLSMEAFSNDGQCSDKSFVQELRVQESKLEVPNAFSPFDSEGVNDVFRVYAKSLVSFEAHIFAQNGQKIYSWYNVEGGWNGRYQGKKLPMGAYYYVIKARGADGIEYNKKGVVNLLCRDGFSTRNNAI